MDSAKAIKQKKKYDIDKLVQKKSDYSTSCYRIITRFKNIWFWIKSRCYNKKDISYKNYWYRWIICLRKDFDWFYNDMFVSYYNSLYKNWEKDTTIERINNNWNYCKKNCKWVTYKEQCVNRRIPKNSIYIIYNGSVKPLHL